MWWGTIVLRWRCCIAAGVVRGAPAAPSEIIDRIVAVVDDEAVFESDVEQAVRQYLFQQGPDQRYARRARRGCSRKRSTTSSTTGS